MLAPDRVAILLPALPEAAAPEPAALFEPDPIAVNAVVVCCGTGGGTAAFDQWLFEG